MGARGPRAEVHARRGRGVHDGEAVPQGQARGELDLRLLPRAHRADLPVHGGAQGLRAAGRLQGRDPRPVPLPDGLLDLGVALHLCAAQAVVGEPRRGPTEPGGLAPQHGREVVSRGPVRQPTGAAVVDPDHERLAVRSLHHDGVAVPPQPPGAHEGQRDHAGVLRRRPDEQQRVVEEQRGAPSQGERVHEATLPLALPGEPAAHRQHRPRGLPHEPALLAAGQHQGIPGHDAVRGEAEGAQAPEPPRPHPEALVGVHQRDHDAVCVGGERGGGLPEGLGSDVVEPSRERDGDQQGQQHGVLRGPRGWGRGALNARQPSFYPPTAPPAATGPAETP